MQYLCGLAIVYNIHVQLVYMKKQPHLLTVPKQKLYEAGGDTCSLGQNLRNQPVKGEPISYRPHCYIKIPHK